jgi:hypothetical protein
MSLYSTKRLGADLDYPEWLHRNAAGAPTPMTLRYVLDLIQPRGAAWRVLFTETP